MSEKDTRLSKREFLKLIPLAGGVIGLELLRRGIGELFFNQAEPPENVQLPDYLEETSVFTQASPTKKSDEITSVDDSSAPTPEPIPTKTELSFNPETDVQIGEINLTKPFVMDIPAETGFAANWGSLRLEVIPWFMFGNTWDDELNAEGVRFYEHFYLGIKDSLITKVSNGNEVIENSFAMLLHSYSYKKNMLSGDWGRTAVLNHINEVPGRDIIGKPIIFYQEGVAPLLLIATSAILVDADRYNTAFKYWEGVDHPMVCDLSIFEIPNLGPNQIHLIACEGGPTDITANRYILSFEAINLVDFIAKQKS